mmetsp:Transcript_16261/g.34363  ORF Transcript_16261/g.34363 Transcript_16261/m.34363 type:complete len:80 (+) Transcript_16261:927-1166(+)
MPVLMKLSVSTSARADCGVEMRMPEAEPTAIAALEMKSRRLLKRTVASELLCDGAVCRTSGEGAKALTPSDKVSERTTA